MELSQEQVQAISFTAKLWTAIRSAHGPRPTSDEFHFLPGLFTPDTLDQLSLPIGKDCKLNQTVALGSNALRFTRPQTPEELVEAYKADPRVRIYESIDAHSGGWTAMVTSALGRLAKCTTTCTVYESVAGEQTLGAHRDGWYGAVVQKEGRKDWYLGDDAKARLDTPTLTMRPGDVLLLPSGVLHDVATPDYSVHMGFALITDR